MFMLAALVHLFRSVEWFDAVKDEHGFSTKVRLPDSFLRTCAEAVAHVGKYCIGITTDAKNEYVEWGVNIDWPEAVVLSDVKRVKPLPLDDIPAVIDLTLERDGETSSDRPTNALHCGSDSDTASESDADDQ